MILVADVMMLVILLVVSVTLVSGQNNAPGVTFVGVGYNILRGNPEEGDKGRGGVDPGILTTRRLFQITWDENRKASDQQ